MISREKADTLFQLFLEVRNRAVQAFENIMRMQF
jgi:flagellar hook-basal body complex protein FliE